MIHLQQYEFEKVGIPSVTEQKLELSRKLNKYNMSLIQYSKTLAQKEIKPQVKLDNTIQWHKHKLSILSNFSPYISMFSGCGSTRSSESGCG